MDDLYNKVSLSDRDIAFLKGVQQAKAQAFPDEGESLKTSNKLLLKFLMLSIFSKNGIEPANGSFDALADDIEGYIESTFRDYVTFYHD